VGFTDPSVANPVPAVAIVVTITRRLSADRIANAVDDAGTITGACVVGFSDTSVATQVPAVTIVVAIAGRLSAGRIANAVDDAGGAIARARIGGFPHPPIADKVTTVAIVVAIIGRLAAGRIANAVDDAGRGRTTIFCAILARFTPRNIAKGVAAGAVQVAGLDVLTDRRIADIISA
jgi:hypothetical protein